MNNVIRPAAFVGNPRHQPNLTSHKGFNDRADLLMEGNTYSNVQRSTFVRARQQLECNGFTNPPGKLQKFDLDSLLGNIQGMATVRRYVETDAFFETNDALVYRIFHYNDKKERVIHGVIVTTTGYRLLRAFDREDLGLMRSEKSRDVLRFALQYLSVPAQKSA